MDYIAIRYGNRNSLDRWPGKNVEHRKATGRSARKCKNLTVDFRDYGLNGAYEVRTPEFFNFRLGSYRTKLTTTPPLNDSLALN